MKGKAAKPFLKWAGGKTQLLDNIEKLLPEFVYDSEFTFVEPFVGSGAVLFRMLDKFPNIKSAVINDVNPDLVNVYKTIASKPKELIAALQAFQSDFHALENKPAQKREYYNQKRALYNSRTSGYIAQAALFIFLNRTCFNGLYRVNKQNAFNVPMGSYKKPTICDAENILAVSKSLKKVNILCGDFEATYKFAGKHSFFYFDPPYKPLNPTSNFNSYARDSFNDHEQERLKNFCVMLDAKKQKWMLSNSDPQGKNSKPYFDELYKGFEIKRVPARRMINSKASARGAVNEIIVTNYTTPLNNGKRKHQ